ncbi:hypothetical protein RFEPED_0846 [Rickettsia felis str. Pedreira]|uniref:Uncharacterized protein n=1 Tax=Rickettsia felis str. Pedreira TaxID=1359196 RepID=A0A0F3MRU8_RICFI|nr:hypothetical protein RFEPED_0846 [Rickettsia felis str. Pedreira]
MAIQKKIKKILIHRIFNWFASSKFSIFPRNDGKPVHATISSCGGGNDIE